ncbi:cytochrome P450 6k1-like [Athalia rosae]|uniref:cytochrome P450 6k1-like n=1 Tax=Athalia rosae TaxID=37344 RepID=UPI0020340BFF|nr:cytochrome P450 6k1-like [Athalia rosae]
MALIHIVGGVILLASIYYYYLTKNYKHWEKKCVPHMKNTLPGFGNMASMILLKSNVYQTFEEIYKKWSGHSMVGFYFGRQPGLLVRDPELVKCVLQTQFPSFSSNGAFFDPTVDRLLSRNPFILEGEPWKVARHQLSSAYTSGKLKYMYGTIRDVLGNFLEYLQGKVDKGFGEAEVELKDIFSRFTAETVARAGLGIDGDAFNDKKDGIFIDIGKQLFDPTFFKGFKTIVTFFAPFLTRLFGASFIPRKIEDFFIDTVKNIIKYRAENNEERSDFLQLMINLKKSGAKDFAFGRDFDDETITSHASSFFIEGYETSSITASFVVYQLARHPDIQQRLRDEILSIVQTHGGNMTYEALQEMKYLEQVIQESMRLVPPGGTMIKVCTNKAELTGCDGVKCEVEPGTMVMISVAGIHKDPEYWPDPEIFDPERFTEENHRARRRFTYLPFGEGPRVCIGTRMAMMLVKSVIAELIRNYDITLSPKTQMPIKLNPHHFMPAPVGGLWMKLKPIGKTNSD